MDNDELRQFRKEWKTELLTKHDGNRLLFGRKDDNIGQHTSLLINEDNASLVLEDVSEKTDEIGFCKIHNDEAFRFVSDEQQVSPTEKQQTCKPLTNKNKIKKSKGQNESAIKTKNKKQKEETSALEKFEIHKSLVDQLISDIDEITAIPFFDQELPREVGIKIFAYLSVVDLCHCAQVNSTWKILAEDELLWHCLGCRHGYVCEKDKTMDKSNWKSLVKECILKERHLRKNWNERICSLAVHDFERGGALCAVSMSGDVICAGYSNAQVRLWSLNSEKSGGKILESWERDALGNEKPQLLSVANNNIICAAGFENGDVSVWHTGLDSPVVHHFQCGGPVKSLAMETAEEPVVLAISDHELRVDTADSNGQWSCFDQRSFEKKVEHVQLLRTSQQGITARSPIAIATLDTVFIHVPGQKADMRTLDHIIGGKATCLDCKLGLLAIAIAPYGYCILGNKVRLYCPESGKQISVLSGHHREITCLNLSDSPPHALCTGSLDKHVRVYDLRTEQVVKLLGGHNATVTTVQMDDLKAVSGSEDGTVRVWDLRMGSQLWSTTARHPVRFCRFTDTRLITANVPCEKNPRQNVWWSDDLILHRRHRGVIRVFDFTVDNASVGIPDICFSSYDDTSGYNYNINLAVPYDDIIEVYDEPCV